MTAFSNRRVRARPALPLHAGGSEHALVGGVGRFMHLEHRIHATLRLDCELQVQPPLLEDLDTVTQAVVLSVLGPAHTDTGRADEARAERKSVADLGV